MSDENENIDVPDENESIDVVVKFRWRRLIGPVILGTLCFVWAANQWQLHTLRGELNDLARKKIIEFRPPGKGLPGYSGRIASEVVVSKPYVLFGKPVGKISVYVEENTKDGASNLDGYEFFLTRQPDASWVETESGHCNSEQCVKNGKRALDAFGETL